VGEEEEHQMLLLLLLGGFARLHIQGRHVLMTFMSANNVDDTGREITVNLKMIPSCSQSILIKPVSHPILQSVWVSGQTLCRLTATNGRNIRMEAIPLTPQEECLYIVGSSGIIKLVLI